MSYPLLARCYDASLSLACIKARTVRMLVSIAVVYGVLSSRFVATAFAFGVRIAKRQHFVTSSPSTSL
eukprot:scaffold159691_cov43-Attheya_sp.AAC.2